MALIDRVGGHAVRVLFTCQPALGHFHPLAPIAQALESAGHQVAFATPAPFVPTAERSGFSAFPAGLTQPTAEAFPSVRSLRGPEEAAFMLRHVRPAQAAAMVSDLLDLLPAWQPGLLVRERGEYGGCIAAERLGIPYAGVEVIAAGYSREALAILSDGLAGVLAEHGLPPDPDLQIVERQAVISPFPPSYRAVTDRVTATPWLSIRPTPFDQSGDERLPEWVDALPEHPSAYLTLGTAPQFNARPKIFRAFIEGLADEPLNLIVAVGRNNEPRDLGPVPGNVRIERYIPRTLLFSRCSLVICHAGSGTVMAAATHGLPLVLVPIAADQPQNARRCAALGLAHVIDADALDPSVARAAVLDTLSDPAYRLNAERLRAEIQALPGPGQAVPFLERLATGQLIVASNG